MTAVSHASARSRTPALLTRIRLIALSASLVLLLACGTGDSTPPPASTPAQLLENLIAADNAGDLEAVLACYAADAVLLPPAGLPIEGIEAIREFYSELVDTTELVIRMEPGTIRDEGTGAVIMGFTQGTATARAGGEPREIHDRFVLYARRESGNRWKITRFLWDPVETGQG
jgi:uncharacterized protein (TIGR02246 family)